jgi:hypothetical protein
MVRRRSERHRQTIRIIRKGQKMTMQGWGVKTIAGLGMFAGWFLACAGDDTPPVEDSLRGALATSFGGADTQMGSAGSAGSGAGGRGGSGSSGSGNAGSANAGSSSAGAAGDGGGPVGGGGSGGGGDFCNAFPILASSCGIVGNCHNEGAGQGAFAASEDDVLDYVDRPSTKGAACDQVFINSSNPEESLIYTRLFGTDCGGTLQMPAAGDFLTEEESDCVLSWLQQFSE